MITAGFILLTSGVFGGAERRFTMLFSYLSDNNKIKLYFFVTHDLKDRIEALFPDINHKNLIAIGKRTVSQKKVHKDFKLSSVIESTKIQPSISKKLYRYWKNKIYQRRLYKEIDKHVKKLNIDVLAGIFNGIIPLYFYLKRSNNRPGIIFCNMDSWFSNITDNPTSNWHRKYSMFNFAHEKADFVDFLSPFILEGVRSRKISIKDERVKITRCSFTDYAKCQVGDKSVFRIGFAGRLEKDKNPLMFLNAAVLLSKEFPDVEFHIMGEGRQERLISELLSKVHFPNIIFHGFHPNPTNILALTSVFVSIQTTNNYPSQSVLEAMACGNAIVASDVGDTRMFVNENNGKLIPLELDALVISLKDYISNPEIAMRHGRFAFDFVRSNFTIHEAAEYYVELFEKAARVITK